jgi:hypothetical protein
MWDIHCPQCGEFRDDSDREPKCCPRCAEQQAIVLLHDFHIDQRFATERREASDAL